jgi:hypothetical protein
VSCALRLDRSGYVPGEDVNVDAEIQNFSRKQIIASYVTMQQVSLGFSLLLPRDIYKGFI